MEDYSKILFTLQVRQRGRFFYDKEFLISTVIVLCTPEPARSHVKHVPPENSINPDRTAAVAAVIFSPQKTSVNQCRI